MLHACSAKADRRFLIPVCLAFLTSAAWCDPASADDELIHAVFQDPAPQWGRFSIAFSPDGRLLVTGTNAGVRFWNVAEGKLESTFDEPTSSLAFSPDGKLLASNALNNRVIVWNVAARNSIVILDAPGAVQQVGFASDGSVLAAAVTIRTARGRSARLLLWETEGWKRVAEFTWEEGIEFSCMAVSPKGNLLAASIWPRGSGDLDVYSGDLLKLIDLKERKIIGSLHTEFGATGPMFFSPDGRRLVVNDNRITKVWDLEERTITRHYKRAGRLSNSEDGALSPDGKIIALAGDVCIGFWDAETLQPFAVRSLGAKHSPRAIAFSPDGKLLAAAGSPWAERTTSIVLWKVPTEKEDFGASKCLVD